LRLMFAIARRLVPACLVGSKSKRVNFLMLFFNGFMLN
jgi:hypothetical protein